MKTRVILVDDHTAIRQLLSMALARSGDYQVIGEADTGLKAVALCNRVKPEVMVLDLMLPELSGLEVLRRVQAECPKTRVLVFSAACNETLLLDVLRAQPAGFVTKGDSLKTFREALDAVRMGANYFAPHAARHLFDSRQERLENGELSPRERQILQRIAESRSSKEIATELGISLKTVENHRAHVMEKLRLHDVAGLTRYAVRNGLIATE